MVEKVIIVTGGGGFIGSAVVRKYLRETDFTVVNIDKLTYAGNLESLGEFRGSRRHIFEKVDICDTKEIARILNQYKPMALMHLAAESHVDRSIDGPTAFMDTNIMGTFNLLERSREYCRELPGDGKERFRFHHVSTDEVFGSLGDQGYFTEASPYQPNSPYSASKAASDHLVRAWYETYGLPTIISNCSNNYGPYQYPEKLIPLIIRKAIAGEALPIYGKGDNVRDWLYVEDHANALTKIIANGIPGEVYNVGGHNEMTNLSVVRTICELLDAVNPRSDGTSYFNQVEFVADRPGHDRRYAIDAQKIQRELNWVPKETFTTGIRKTVEWYLQNQAWCRLAERKYSGERLGLGVAR